MKKQFLYALFFANTCLYAQAPDWQKNNQLLLEQAQTFAAQKDWAKYIDNGVAITNTLLEQARYEEVIQTAQEFTQKIESAKVSANIALAALYKNVGKAYYGLVEDNNSLAFLEKDLKILQQLNPDNSTNTELEKAYYNVGQMQRLLGRYMRSKISLEKGLLLAQNNPKTELLLDYYRELATAYIAHRDYEKSLKYAELYLIMTEQQTGKETQAFADALNLRGEAFGIAGDYEKAGNDFRRALRIASALPSKDPLSLSMYCQNIAASFAQSQKSEQETNKSDSAIAYFKTAETYLNTVPNSDKFPLYTKMIGAHIGAKKYTEAKPYIDKAAALAAAQNGQKSPQVANFYNQYGLWYFYQKDANNALAYFHKQLLTSLEDYNNPDVNSLPTPQEAAQKISDLEYRVALSWKARAHWLAFKTSQSEKDLELGLKTFELFDTETDHLRKETSTADNTTSMSFSVAEYETAINLCLGMFANTKQASWKEKAFFYSEKSRSLALLAAFKSSNARKFANVPEEVIEKELNLRLDISQLEQDYFALNARKKKEFLPRLAELQAQIAQLKSEQEKFSQELNTKYPEYVKIQAQTSVQSISALQKTLNNEQTMLEYFVGDESTFIFKITANGLDIYTQNIGADDLNTKVRDFRDGLYGEFLSIGDKNEQTIAMFNQKYVTGGVDLYKLLVQPALPLTKRLVVVPDGALTYLPFDALLTDQPADAKQFASHPYFILKHMVSYAYSATSLDEMRNQVHGKATNTFLGFAPEFGTEKAAEIRGKRYDLSPLVYNVPEVENIRGILKSGTIYLRQEATEAQFKSVASDYKIIHFATHGMANNDHPDFSLLAFTEIQDTIENEYLYSGDLYNLRLNADLVVLSACETGLGKMSRGEGILSLARGFAYAGSKSILTTLWSVNDQATAIIVEGFYKHIKAGKSKDEALQLSRLEFLEKTDNKTAHPFLWAPFIMIGDTAPIQGLDSLPDWLVYGGILGLILAGGFGFNILRNRYKLKNEIV